MILPILWETHISNIDTRITFKQIFEMLTKLCAWIYCLQ